MQRLPGERRRQRDQCGVAGDRAREVDPVELPDRRGCLARGSLQLRGAAIQQGAPQVVGLEVFAIAIHAAIAGPYQRAVGIAWTHRQGVHAACAETVEAEIGANPEIAFAIDDDRYCRCGGQSLRRIEAFHAHGPGAGEGDVGNAAVRTHRGPQRAIGSELQARSDQFRQPPCLTFAVCQQTLRVRQWRGAAHPVGQPNFTLRAFGQRRHLRDRDAGVLERGLARRAHPDLQAGQHPEPAPAVVQHPLHTVLGQAGSGRQWLPAVSVKAAQPAIDRRPELAIAILAEARHHADRHPLLTAVAVQPSLREAADAGLEVADPQGAVGGMRQRDHVGGRELATDGRCLPFEATAIEAVQARAGSQPQEALTVLGNVPYIAWGALADTPGGMFVIGQPAAHRRALHGKGGQGGQQQQARQQRRQATQEREGAATHGAHSGRCGAVRGDPNGVGGGRCGRLSRRHLLLEPGHAAPVRDVP